ncbi:Uncharacterized protein BM_BM16939 [Brugia malayi]|uniref:Bm16939 n=1 Tax=Brugia malayi TaxID=6279 RepID=A0A0K0J2M6_BRUMA|nr:Uncharacterized protein BM_BM16939 [Brugia malayi]CRZ26036.1 Bm16939 [Brugia malayi]VIO86679.1 Uncharacterized protein BM_BM16939 [Brugia malayi]
MHLLGVDNVRIPDKCFLSQTIGIITFCHQITAILSLISCLQREK